MAKNDLSDEFMDRWKKTEEEEAPKPIGRLEEEHILNFVRQYCDNEVFTTAHMDEREMSASASLVFMPLALGAMQSIADPENIGLVYEKYSAAGPRSMNGFPIFFSCNFMHKDDWAKAIPLITEEMKRREGKFGKPKEQ